MADQTLMDLDVLVDGYDLLPREHRRPVSQLCLRNVIFISFDDTIQQSSCSIASIEHPPARMICGRVMLTAAPEHQAQSSDYGH